MAMACHSSGGLLATGGADKRVCVWDIDGGYCTHYFRGHQGVVTSIIFHPNASRLLLFSGSDDATVRVWNLETKRCAAVLDKHFSAVTSLAVSENGQTLLSAGRDKVVNVWDLRSYTFQSTIPTYEILEAICIIHSDTEIFASIPKKIVNGSNSPTIYFLTIGERGIVRIWSTEGAICLYEQQTSDATITSDADDTRRGFTTAAILPRNHGLLCVTADQQFLFYCPAQSSEGAFELNLYRRLVGYNEEIVDLKFLGEEDEFLAVATNLEQVRIYELSSMSCSYVLTGHKDIVLCLDTCVTVTGKTLLLTGSKDNTVRLWEAETHKCIGLGAGHTGAIGAIAFSKKNKNFFVSGSSDRTIKFWSFDGILEDGSLESKLKPRALVAAHDKDINSLAVSPNDTLLCSGSQDRTACIWRLPDLIYVLTLKGHKRGVWSVEFSPVDQCVITSSGDKTIKLWAISGGSCLKTFEGHTSSVLRASFLSRGAQIISCGADGLVKLWTVKTSECIATYDQHDDKVWALAVGGKSEMLATGGGDALVNLWHDCTTSDREEALRKEEEEVLRGQELENAISEADYLRAIKLAFELRRPHRLFELFSLLQRKRTAEDPTKRALHSLGKEEIRLLLEYIREWNTKPRLCHVAQTVLSQIFKLFPPNDIIEMKGVAELLEGLIPYSQRHFVRVDRLVRSTYLLDYTLAKMSVLVPDTNSLLDSKEVVDDDNLQEHDVLVSEKANMEEKQNSHGAEMIKNMQENDVLVSDMVSKEEKKNSPGAAETETPKKRKSSRSRKGCAKKTKESPLSGMIDPDPSTLLDSKEDVDDDSLQEHDVLVSDKAIEEENQSPPGSDKIKNLQENDMLVSNMASKEDRKSSPGAAETETSKKRKLRKSRKGYEKKTETPLSGVLDPDTNSLLASVEVADDDNLQEHDVLMSDKAIKEEKQSSPGADTIKNLQENDVLVSDVCNKEQSKSSPGAAESEKSKKRKSRKSRKGYEKENQGDTIGYCS